MSNFISKQKERKNHKHLGVATTIAGKGKNTKGRPKTGRETKVRVNFAILPSLYKKIQRVAYIKRISVSEILSECFERYINENEDIIS